MEDFNSKYSGEQVEALLDQVASGNAGGGGGGGIAVETDPIFSASAAASITEEKKAEWDNKVDKVSGKQLSTEDFTSALKAKLEGLSNYDDTELSNALSTLRGDFDKLVSGDTSTAIKTFNEVIAFLDGIQDSQDLSSIIASIEQHIAGKMDKVTLATVATSGSYNDLTDKPTIPSEQVNADWNAKSGKAQILNKPTIPSQVTESTVSGWGFTKNTGTYSKPSSGIPASDLASDVRDAISKADGAVQCYIAQTTLYELLYDDGLIALPQNDMQSILDALTQRKLVLFPDPFGMGAGTENSGYGVMIAGYAEDLLYFSVADTLGSVFEIEVNLDGTIVSRKEISLTIYNTKTINGQSLVGSGDITIEGGGSGSSAMPLVDHGTNGTTSMIAPNVFHRWGEVASLTLTLGAETAGVANQYTFEFSSGSTATVLALPDSLKWADDNVPTIEPNMIYQISILNGLAVALKWNNSKVVVTIHFNIAGTDCQAEEGMVWNEWVGSSYDQFGYLSATDTRVANPYSGKELYKENVKVKGTDIIIASATYSWK